jgi:hypothetical protein
MLTGADLFRLQGAILPVQFHPPRGIRSERRLVIAILEDAVEIRRKYTHRSGRRYERLVAETESWFFSDDTAWPLSFLNVCAALGLDAAWFRAQLTAPSRTPPTVLPTPVTRRSLPASARESRAESPSVNRSTRATATLSSRASQTNSVGSLYRTHRRRERRS